MEFEKQVKRNNRYIHNVEVSKFLNTLKETLHKKNKLMPKGTPLHRSQIGYNETWFEGEEIIIPLSNKRMKPTASVAKEGRANPKGIPYLYLATDRDTSISELRPHIEQIVTYSGFEASKDLNIIDCYSIYDSFSYIGSQFYPPTTQAGIEDAVWSMINSAFAKPTTNNDTTTEYIPTQIIAELFKSEGYDGLCLRVA